MGKAYKCLIVEDAPMIRRIIEMMMGRLNFHVTAANDGVMALEACTAALPDIILLDWSMPKMDGLTFVAELRRLPGGDRPKVIMCTVNNEAHHIARATEAGVDAYLAKPFQVDDIVSTLETLKVFAPG